MSSVSGTCEIVESIEELNSLQNIAEIQRLRAHDKGGKIPLGKKVCNEDDINKLFETISLKSSSRCLNSSEEVGASPSKKYALKRPMRAGMSPPSGIGISEPVSLKQALRGLCISQASEMAAIKRSSRVSCSPRISEAGTITSLYRSVVEASESGLPLPEAKKGKEAEVSLVLEESISNSSEKIPDYHQAAGMMANRSTHTSPRFAIIPAASLSRKNEIVPAPKEVSDQRSKMEPPRSEKCNPVRSLPYRETAGSNSLVADKANSGTVKLGNTSGSVKLGNTSEENVSASTKVVSKEAIKLRRKGRLQTVSSSSSTLKSSMVRKSIRSGSRVKPVVRSKNLVKKKPKQDSVSTVSSSYAKNAVNDDSVLGGKQLICQKCQCALKDAGKLVAKNSEIMSIEVSSSNGNYAATKPIVNQNGCDKIIPAIVKNNDNSKSGEKGDLSQSSKSSIGDYSSSTSISEESSVSGSSFGNKPHMSRDLRWEAIHHAIKKHGFLGLGHFNLLKKLGCGDIGTVYLAELIGKNCVFAIKVMDNEFLARRKKMPRAKTEREILRMLDHPFLPTLYAQFTSDNLSCLVMEYCPGGDLHVLRQKQPGRYFPEQAARFYVAEVLLALEYLHMLGIVYRDLKPENILVREDGHIMLTDFDLSLRCSVNPTLLKSPPLGMEPPRMSGPCAGSSCIDPFCSAPSCKVSCFTPRLFLSSEKSRKQNSPLGSVDRSLPQLVAEPTDARSNSFVGTHEYLAPEIIKGEGHGSAVDWWTFGVFLYELLYGKTPFKGAGNEETLFNVVRQSLKFPDSPIVSFQARDLIRGLLVKEPENRFGSEKGATEIKQHPFFHGLNWALIRCAIPPQLPDFSDIGVPKIPSQDKGRAYMEYRNTGEHLEFELF